MAASDGGKDQLQVDPPSKKGRSCASLPGPVLSHKQRELMHAAEPLPIEASKIQPCDRGCSVKFVHMWG